MDSSRFDQLMRALAGSRRSVLGGTLALAAGSLGVSPGEAKKKHKKRKSKAKPNEFGCLEVGDPCKNADQCCSGMCEGKKGKKTCRAHDAGSCSAGEQRAFFGGTVAACTTSAGVPGVCATTTGNGGYCLATSYCIACATDADCQATYGGILGPHAACIRSVECVAGIACAVPDLSAEP